jgi:hypothetical protein
MHKFIISELNRFLSEEAVSNIQFAEWYGCTPNYVSKMRHRAKPIDVYRMAKAFLENGYSFRIDFQNQTIHW